MNAFEFPTINQPTVGKFYRLKNGASGWYATSTLRTGEAQHSNKLYMKEAGNTAESVWYLAEGNKLVSFKEGRYLGDMSSDWSFEAVGAEGNAVVFNESAVVGRYQILPSSGRALYGDQVRVDAADSNQKSGNYAWELEEVTWLPVPMNTTAGYATLYAPVALNNGGRVEAYVGKVEGDWFTMSRVDEDGVIPANTPVVLKYVPGAQTDNGCVYLEVSNSDKTTAEENALQGTFADTYFTDAAYALGYINVAEEGQPEDKQVGFYAAQMTDGKWLNNGFKAYLPKTTEAKTLRFNFDGETTAIDAVEVVNPNAPIYDLSGRRVLSTVKGGIYIQNGKKFIVK